MRRPHASRLCDASVPIVMGFGEQRMRSIGWRHPSLKLLGYGSSVAAGTGWREP